MAGRAIAERAPPLETLPAVTQQDDLPRGRLLDHFHTENREDRPEYQEAHAAKLREHCSKQIPGYTGHVPRVEGDTVYGATTRDANLVAADLIEETGLVAWFQDALLLRSCGRRPTSGTSRVRL
eukprot:g15113.t1